MGAFVPAQDHAECPLPGQANPPNKDRHGSKPAIRRSSANDRSWRIPEVLPAPFASRLRPLGSGQIPGLMGSLRLILCGQMHRPNVFQGFSKFRLRCEAHGSISVQEGQPGILGISDQLPSLQKVPQFQGISARRSVSETVRHRNLAAFRRSYRPSLRSRFSNVRDFSLGADGDWFDSG
jgi:hypothetical protein